jgi:hypothetical protein
MALPTEDLYRLLAEVANGVDPKQSTLPDTPEVRAKRAQLEKEVAEIRAGATRSTSPTNGTTPPFGPTRSRGSTRPARITPASRPLSRTGANEMTALRGGRFSRQLVCGRPCCWLASTIRPKLPETGNSASEELRGARQ